VGRYRQQWLWSCTTCGAVCEPDTEPAATIIDWRLPCPRIADRTRPLAPATRARILAGLQRYGWAPITTSGAGNVHERTPGNRARPVTDQLPVQQTTATTALATPPGFLVQPAHGARLVPIDQPHPTVCASDDRHALVVPMRRNGRAADVDQPVPTVTAGGTHHGLIVRNYGNEGGNPGRHVTPSTEPVRTITAQHGQGLLMRNNGTTAGEDWATTPTDQPARTMTTKGHQSLLVPFQRGNVARTPAEPITTVTTRDKVGLVNVEQIVDDCGFRMLEPYEVAAAMAFPDGYIPRTLPKKDQIKLAGNAVTPPVMTWIVGRIIRALEDRA
jgi:DNA (cytosine-5)-methyltransferase 1